MSTENKRTVRLDGKVLVYKDHYYFRPKCIKCPKRRLHMCSWYAHSGMSVGLFPTTVKYYPDMAKEELSVVEKCGFREAYLAGGVEKLTLREVDREEWGRFMNLNGADYYNSIDRVVVTPEGSVWAHVSRHWNGVSGCFADYVPEHWQYEGTVAERRI